MYGGEVKNSSGESIEGRFSTVDGYDLTACGTVEVAEYLLADHLQSRLLYPQSSYGKRIAGKNARIFRN